MDFAELSYWLDAVAEHANGDAGPDEIAAIRQDLDAVGIRSYVAEPDRGRRDWSEEPDAQAPVYGNRHRMRGRDLTAATSLCRTHPSS